MKVPKIPRVVDLPFGFTITVKLISDRQLEKYTKDKVYGFWDGDKGTVYISKSLSKDRQLEILLHEMKHAYADWDHFVREVVIAPIQAEVAETVIKEIEEEL